MVGRRPGQVPPTRWSEDQLDADRMLAIETFRRVRLEEPTEEFSERFAKAQAVMEDLLEETLDLTAVYERALSILSKPASRDALRYIAGPPISLDDLKTLVDTNSVAPQTLRGDPDLVRRIVAIIFEGLDRGRFPWVPAGRAPMPHERDAAVLATATLIATQGVATNRRTQGKKAQEARVREVLLAAGFSQVRIAGGQAGTIRDAPKPGEFSRETVLGTRKADLVVGLWDGRIMPIECKVSNSSINSVKRLNNDAAVKAAAWIADFGERHVVPVAVLSGVYWLPKLVEAQARGLTLYWDHRLADLTEWIERTRT